MKDPTLRQLEYFVAVADTGSVTGAAERCHISQAAASAALTQLEEALGAPLMIRRRAKGVALTAEGRAVAERARRLLDDVAALRNVVHEVHGELAGPVSIGCFRSLAVDVVPHLAEWFATRHPRVEPTFVEGNGLDLQRAMLEGRHHICLLYQAQLSPECDEILLVRRSRRLVISPDHPLAQLEEVRFRDLAPYPAALMAEEPALQMTLAEFYRHGVQPQVRYRSRDVLTLRSLVGRGLAYSVLMQEVPTSPEGRPLLFRSLADPIPDNPLIASLPRGGHRGVLVEEVLTAMRALAFPADEPSSAAR